MAGRLTAAYDGVATDNLEAGRRAARHLYERGFRSPTVIAGPPALRTTEDRATGFLSVWRELGVEVGADALRRGDLHLGSGRAVMEQLLAAGEARSEEHTSELQSRFDLVCRLQLAQKNT